MIKPVTLLVDYAQNHGFSDARHASDPSRATWRAFLVKKNKKIFFEIQKEIAYNPGRK